MNDHKEEQTVKHATHFLDPRPSRGINDGLRAEANVVPSALFQTPVGMANGEIESTMSGKRPGSDAEAGRNGEC